MWKKAEGRLAEIMRGKKERKRRNHSMKIYMSASCYAGQP